MTTFSQFRDIVLAVESHAGDRGKENGDSAEVESSTVSTTVSSVASVTCVAAVVGVSSVNGVDSVGASSSHAHAPDPSSTA